jgi:hypothetical protein
VEGESADVDVECGKIGRDGIEHHRNQRRAVAQRAESGK